MRVLVTGLGSIGKRHATNLEALGVPCRDIIFLRRNASPNPFGDAFLKDHPEHPVVHDFTQALGSHRPDIAVVTNPTARHVPVALEAAKHGMHLLIEKPLSHSLEGVDELIATARARGITAAVAYQLRFHPLLRQVKVWLDEERIGRVISAHAEIAERVTDWHPWENFRIGYAVRSDLGGGIIVTQSHELDYFLWLFGKPRWAFSAGGTRGDLSIGVEDSVKSIIGFAGDIEVSLHTDYLKRPPKRELEIVGTAGRIRWDYYGREAALIPLDSGIGPTAIRATEPPDFERNTMYLDEVGHFLECVRTGMSPMVPLAHGRDVLALCEAMHQSLRSGRVIDIP